MSQAEYLAACVYEFLKILGVLKVTGKGLITNHVKSGFDEGFGHRDVEVILHHDRYKIDSILPGSLLLGHFLV